MDLAMLPRIQEPDGLAGLVPLPSLGPASVGLPAPDGLSLVEGVLPSRVVWRSNTLREPDEATVVIDSHYLPLDPRMVRQVAVDIYMGGLLPAQYDAGMTAGTGAALLTTPDKLRFIGWVDEGVWDVHDGTISLECRSLQALLTDSKIGASLLGDIELARPLHAVVHDVVQAAPMARGMTVVARTDSPGTIPVLGTVVPPHWIRVAGKTKGARMPIEDGAESYWSIIERLCLAVGWVPSVQLDRVVVQPAKTLTADRFSAPVVDVAWPTGVATPAKVPFQRTISQTGETVRIRRLAWGHNLETFRLTRPWAETRRKPIEVRAWNKELGIVATARWPILPEPARVAPSGQKATEEVDVIVVYGQHTPVTLLQLAEQLWHERAHRDVRGEFSTRDLASFGGGAPGDLYHDDLMGLEAGDAVEVGIYGARNQASAPEAVKALSAPELGAFLVSRGFRPDVAAQFAAAALTTPLLNVFRVVAAEHTFDAEEGYSLSVEFANYLRADPAAAAQQAQAAALDATAQ